MSQPYSSVKDFDYRKIEKKALTPSAGHVIDRQWKYPKTIRQDFENKHEENMIAQGYWKRCENCQKVFNPRYEHEC